jgi:hypothetical protein
MPKISTPSTCWDTSSLGRPAGISAQERSTLSDHLNLCGAQRGPLHRLRAGVDGMQGILAGRVVTSVLVVTVLVGGSWLMR